MIKRLFFLFLILFLFTSCVPEKEVSATDTAFEESESDVSFFEESEVETSEADESVDEMEKKEIPVLSIVTGGKGIGKEQYADGTLELRDLSREFEMIYDTAAQIKIPGNSTAGAPKKPYNIKLSSKRNVLGLGEARKWYLLANHYDKTLMRNKLSLDLAQVLGLSNSPLCRYVDVYLDGKLLGNYLLCESIGIGDDRVDLNIDNNEFLFEVEPFERYSNPSCFRTPVFNYILGYNDREKPTPEQEEFAIEFFRKAETAVKNKDWDEITRYFDVDSFVNYYLLKEFLKSVDTESSVRYYIKGGKLYAGPVWDIDLSMGNCDTDFYKVYNNVGGSGDSTEGLYLTQVPSQCFSHLMKIDEFRVLLRERMEEMELYLENLYKKNELGESRIDVLLAQYGDSFLRNYEEANWRIDYKYSNLERDPDETFEKNVEYLRSWLEKRHEWLNDELGVTIK